MTIREPIHAAAWAIWLAATAVALTTTRNPLYIGMILLWIAVVNASVRMTRQTRPDAVPLSPLRFSLLVVPLATLFNVMSVHIGATVLATLPPALPLIGGPLTLEAAVYGALNGLVLTGLLAAFLVLNRALTVRSLVGLIPRAYYPVAVIVSIAITFVPVTLAQFQRIREAQAIRGHRTRGVRGWLPLFLPLLMSGMERALQLAEAMTARGFASRDATQSGWSQAALVTGLCAAGSGIVMRTLWNRNATGLSLLVVGAALVVAGLWLVGRQHPRTSYRPAPIRLSDWLIIVTALLMILCFLMPNTILDRSSLYYYPYPTLTLPNFHMGLGVATWALLTPALVLFATTQRPTIGASS